MMEPISQSPRSDTAEQVESLLRQAHVVRLRGQGGAAESLVRRALALSPEDPTGIEMLADIHADKGEYESALELYRSGLALRPGAKTLEEKIGRTVLRVAEDERERLAAQFMLSSPVSRKERQRNATVATLLSLLCPGVGQLFTGQQLKGGILLVVGVMALFLGVPDLFKMALIVAGGKLPRGESVNQPYAALGVLGMLIWIYGMLDAAAQAGRRPGPADV